MDDNYVFLTSFDCTITIEQESQTLICHLITEKNTIHLKTLRKIIDEKLKDMKPKTNDFETRNYAFNRDQPIRKYIEDSIPANMIDGRTDSMSNKNRPSRSIFRRKTSKKRKGSQIMISYVRHEAADHALQLKKSLLEYGFSVYL
ncbi:hypothetical protein BLA29_007143, partial [Euroglyphus maynei]